jgi:hypothetical protein
LFAFAQQRLGAFAGAAQQLLGFAPNLPGGADLAAQSGQSGMGVEQGALGIGPQQRLVSMLAVDIDQPFADFAQLLNGGRRAVDVGARAAAGIDDAAQQQLVVSVEIVISQPVAYLGQAGDVESRRHLGLVAAGAHDAGIGRARPSASARASIRIDLPAPVSPVRAPKPAEKASSSRSTMTKSLDGQLAQHQGPFGRSLHCSFWRSMAK